MVDVKIASVSRFNRSSLYISLQLICATTLNVCGKKMPEKIILDFTHNPVRKFCQKSWNLFPRSNSLPTGTRTTIWPSSKPGTTGYNLLNMAWNATWADIIECNIPPGFLGSNQPFKTLRGKPWPERITTPCFSSSSVNRKVHHGPCFLAATTDLLGWASQCPHLSHEESCSWIWWYFIPPKVP